MTRIFKKFSHVLIITSIPTRTSLPSTCVRVTQLHHPTALLSSSGKHCDKLNINFYFSKKPYIAITLCHIVLFVGFIRLLMEHVILKWIIYIMRRQLKDMLIPS